MPRTFRANRRWRIPAWTARGVAQSRLRHRLNGGSQHDTPRGVRLIPEIWYMKLIGHQNIMMVVPRMPDTISTRLLPALTAGYLSPSTGILTLFIRRDIPTGAKKRRLFHRIVSITRSNSGVCILIFLQKPSISCPLKSLIEEHLSLNSTHPLN
jgi:hypothetical protein